MLTGCHYLSHSSAALSLHFSSIQSGMMSLPAALATAWLYFLLLCLSYSFCMDTIPPWGGKRPLAMQPELIAIADHGYESLIAWQKANLCSVPATLATFWLYGRQALGLILLCSLSYYLCSQCCRTLPERLTLGFPDLRTVTASCRNQCKSAN